MRIALIVDFDLIGTGNGCRSMREIFSRADIQLRQTIQSCAPARPTRIGQKLSTTGIYCCYGCALHDVRPLPPVFAGVYARTTIGDRSRIICPAPICTRRLS
jgi:hypothetical protein